MREPAGPDLWPCGLVAIYREGYADFVRLAYLLCGSRELAEEAVQDAFVAVRGRWDDITTSEGGYVRTAVVHQVYQRQRRTQTARKHEFHQHRQEASATPSTTRAEIADVLDRLSWPQRVAVVARYWLDFRDEEIAELLGCRPATVRSHLLRGLSVLRKELDPK
ncbi:MAG: sigma-70 family RNA polymerase sigma factor [Acidimicrobiia bacterium]|nr:sigma-70 family RNA polymerase sigma factor [Acidimicrobiia bacterium]